MPTTDPANPHVNDHERAVRLVLGYPEEGPVSVAAAYTNGRTFRRLVETYVDPVDAMFAEKWWQMVGSAWCTMLDLARVPHDGPTTVYRCVCAESAVRVMLVESMIPGRALADFAVPQQVAAIAAEFDYRTSDGMAKFERAMYAGAGLDFPCEQIADASGLRITEAGPGHALRLVEHARACTLPYPFRLVAKPIRPEVVGDVS